MFKCNVCNNHKIEDEDLEDVQENNGVGQIIKLKKDHKNEIKCIKIRKHLIKIET